MKPMPMALLIFHSGGDCREQTGSGLFNYGAKGIWWPSLSAPSMVATWCKELQASPPPTWGSHTPDDLQGKNSDGARPHGWASPIPAEQPRSGSLLSIPGPAAQASECRQSCASRNTVPFGFPHKAFSLLQKASAFLKPQPILRSSEP